MKRFIWLWVFLLCSGRLAAGQGGTLPARKPPTQGTSPSSGEVVEAAPTGCLEEKGGTFRLRGEGSLYNLEGHEKELAGHDGDEVHVTGKMVLPQGLPAALFSYVRTIKVETVEILHDNDPAGRAPALGAVAGWKTHSNLKYGVQFRVPNAFMPLKPENLHINANFVTSEGIETLGGFSFPAATYPNTKFGQGSFAVYVNPGIHSEGTCQQFGHFEPKRTLLSAIHGIKFAQMLLGFGAAGSFSDVHYFHTYQNGLCYEFGFDFEISNSMPDDLPICAVQSIYTQNERQLTDALLAAVRFIKPEFQPVEPAGPRSAQPPVVTSFTQTPVPSDNAQWVRVTWTTKGADYVQLHWPSTKKLYVSGPGWCCGYPSNRNFPPKGDVKLLLSNFNKDAMTLELSVEPFFDGVGYPKRSKTLTFSVNPHR